MNSKSSVVSFENVSVGVSPAYDSGVDEVTFDIAAGDCLFVVTERNRRRLPLADLAEGLFAPDAGEVSFEGRSWKDLSPDNAARCRGRIGRVFFEHAWISNLDIDENITLAQRHLTHRPLADIQSEALALARLLGWDDLPHTRPAWENRADLQRAQWIRALMGQRSLLLLEYPEEEATADSLDLLWPVIEKRRSEGVAVLWFTFTPGLWENKRVGEVSVRYMRGPRLTEA